MNIKRHRIISSLVFFIVAITGFIFSTYAWLDYTHRLNNDIVGAVRVGLKSYFGGGTGSSTTPFIIAEEEHMYNLASLQNLGYLQSQTYYFKVVPLNTQVKYIDFTDYHSIPPIGTHIYPFVSVFDGDYSNLKYLTIDGSGLQDIGVFGNIGTGGQVKNLFLEEPEIISNPLSSLDMTNFHVHNNNIKNIATGYIVGHLGIPPVVEPPGDPFRPLSNVFVIAPQITSLSNNNLNRSQFGLIGFNSSDLGVITGGPRDAYNFSLNAPNAYISLAYAIRDLGSWLVDGSNVALNTILYGTSIVNGVITGKVNLNPNYSISTIKIYQPGYNPVYLYDKMVELGYSIEGVSGTSSYSRDNVDLVGRVATPNYILDSTKFYFKAQPVYFSLTLNSNYIPTTYKNTLIIFVKPPRDNSGILGNVSLTNLQGGGDLGLYGAFVADASKPTGYAYVPNREFKNRSSFTEYVLPGINEIHVDNAFAAVTKNSTTGVMTVVDPNVTTPDFYVVMFAVTNSQSDTTLEEISFEFIPSVLTEQVLQSVENVDFIYSMSDTTTINSIINNTYTFSKLNFGYDLTVNQKLNTRTVRNSDGSFNVYLDYDISDYSTFYFDMINIYNKNINIYVNGVQTEPTITNDIIEIIFQSSLVGGDSVTYVTYDVTT